MKHAVFLFLMLFLFTGLGFINAHLGQVYGKSIEEQMKVLKLLWAVMLILMLIGEIVIWKM